MSVEEIIQQDSIPDKPEVHATTTHKFKKDFWDFFNTADFKKVNFVEFGTSRGYTAKIASYLFKQVHTINIRIDKQAEEYLASRENITLYAFDLYKSSKQWEVMETGDVFLIDAMHTYKAVTQDIETALKELPSKNKKKYLVFDDYGAFPEVKRAIDQAINKGLIKEVARIGQETGYCYGEPAGETTRTLTDSEGIICQEV